MRGGLKRDASTTLSTRVARLRFASRAPCRNTRQNNRLDELPPANGSRRAMFIANRRLDWHSGLPIVSNSPISEGCKKMLPLILGDCCLLLTIPRDRVERQKGHRQERTLANRTWHRMGIERFDAVDSASLVFQLSLAKSPLAPTSIHQTRKRTRLKIPKHPPCKTQ